MTNQYGVDVTDQPRHQANLNPIRYRGYYYDAELNMYWLTTRFYDPETGRFINADAQLNDGMLGNNLYAYCANDPINAHDPMGTEGCGCFVSFPEATCGGCREAGNARYWHDLWESIKKFFQETFGAGVVQAQSYEMMKLETFFFGFEEGLSTSRVLAGDISKPISLYAENASEWWKIWEYKVGIQISWGKQGLSIAINPLEVNITLYNGEDSLQLICGLNKVGYTYSENIDISTRTAERYYHGYVRTIPTALALVLIYYTGGAAAPILLPAK